jgi:hypothetical protein
MIAKRTQSLAELFEADETAWLDTMAELVRQRRLDELDCDHLAEYLEDMALRDRREISSRLRVLIVHVLKWTYQKNMRTPSWETTVLDQQAELEEPLAKGVVRHHAEEVLADIYKKAVKYAARQTKLPAKTFPKECPWTLDHLLAEEVMDQ